MQIEATEQAFSDPNSPEADSIAENEIPLIRYTPGDFGAGITEVSSTNHWISRRINGARPFRRVP